MIQSILVGKQEPGAAGYIVSTFRRQRAKNAGPQLPFTLYIPGFLPGECCHPQWAVLPSSVTQSKTIPTTQAYLPGDSEFLLVDS